MFISLVSKEGNRRDLPPRHPATSGQAGRGMGDGFISGRTALGKWQIWKVPSTGGQAVQVTKRGGREAVESTDGKFVYYSKGFDIAGLWKVPADGGGDEALILNGPIQGKWSVSG